MFHIREILKEPEKNCLRITISVVAQKCIDHIYFVPEHHLVMCAHTQTRSHAAVNLICVAAKNCTVGSVVRCPIHLTFHAAHILSDQEKKKKLKEFFNQIAIKLHFY